MNNAPCKDRLKAFVSYDPDTGKMVWLKPDQSYFKSYHAMRVFHGQYSGKPAFNTDRGNGYLFGGFGGSLLMAHRVAWCLYYGDWPEFDLDHVNRDRSDNRIKNLRSGEYHDNNRNRGMLSNNKSGFKGVSWNKRIGAWRVGIRHDGGRIFKEGFSDPVDAAKYYDKMAIELHGEYATTNESMGLL